MQAGLGSRSTIRDSKLADTISHCKPNMADTLENRLKLACSQGDGVDETAKKAGIARRTFGNWLKGKGQPRSDDLVAIAKTSGVTIEWLATGRGPMREAERVGATPVPEAVQKPAPLGSVPVIGLAQCGLKGWYQEDAMTVRAGRPADLADPDAFAVIAIGTSMIPAGVEPGFLLFCSPAAGAEPGDRVFVERREGGGTVGSVKLLRKIEDGWLVLQGWLAPEDGQAQKPYTERIKRSEVRRIAPAIYMKLKL